MRKMKPLLPVRFIAFCRVNIERDRYMERSASHESTESECALFRVRRKSLPVWWEI